MSKTVERGKYYEELSPGDEYISFGRTIFQNTIEDYAQLTADWNPMHSDAEFSGKSQFGQIIAHGPLTFSIGVGLLARLGLLNGTGIAYLEAFHRCTLPVFVGDTLHLRVRVTDRKESVKKDRGVVSLAIDLINQKDQVVQEQTWKMLMKRKPREAD